LAGYPFATETNTEHPKLFMEKECDFLVPAAIEKSIHIGNVNNLKCKVVVEGANGPTTFAADEALNKKGIVVCPDLLMNGGGVTCSYFEWLKNIDHVSPGKLSKKYKEKSERRLLELVGFKDKMDKIEGATEIDIVYSGLEEIMTSAVKQNWQYAVDHNVQFRDACLMNGIYKVYQCYQECGLTV